MAEDLRALNAASSAAPEDTQVSPRRGAPPTADLRHLAAGVGLGDLSDRGKLPERSPGGTHASTSGDEFEDEDEEDFDDNACRTHARLDPLSSMVVSHGSVPPVVQLCEPDFAGDLKRKVSRLQAISNHTLTTWKKEWCVLSHNFLVLFASRSDWTIRKCVLLSSIAQVLPHESNGRLFKILLDTRTPLNAGSGCDVKISDKIVFRVPTKASSGANESQSSSASQPKTVHEWIDQINKRVDMAKQCGGRLVPCLPYAEASKLVERFQKEMEQASVKSFREVQEQRDSARNRVLAQAICRALETKMQINLRGAFEELVLNARLQAWRMQRRSVGARRIVRALARPSARYVRDALFCLVDAVTADREAAALIFAAERKRAKEKAINLGVLILAGVVRDWQTTLAHETLVQLTKHVQSVRRVDENWPKRGKTAVAAFSQRLHVGGYLLRVAIHHMKLSRCEDALRTWSIMAARCQRAEADELIQATGELNQQLMDRCRQIPFESSLHGLVLSLRAAQRRRVLLAFCALRAMPPQKPVIKFSNSDQQASLRDTAWRSSGLLCVSNGSPPPPDTSIGRDLEEPLSFSPFPRNSANDSSVICSISPSMSPLT